MGNKKSNFFENVPLPDNEQLLNCMRCGMCLPVCPTYELTKLEKHSPRGRIRLIKAVAEGDLEITENFIESIEFCLNCQACVTACPAGVKYGQLVEAAHYHIEEYLARNGRVPLLKKILLGWVFLKQSRLRFLSFLMYLYQRSGLEKLLRATGILKILSSQMHDMSAMLPELKWRKSYPVFKSGNTMHHRQIKVGVPTGCVQDVFFNQVNHDTIEVLAINGYDVFTPKNQQCCGSVHGHNGDLQAAKTLARSMIDTFLDEDVDYIVINSAGCGSFMKEYGHFLSDDPLYADKAARFSGKVLDISEFLVQVGFIPPHNPLNCRVTYHEPCHLVHGQKVKNPPRQLLKALPGIEFVEMAESDWCCGSAGIYNITHYDASMELLKRKMNNIIHSGAEYVVTGNPGCLLQLLYGAKRFGCTAKIIHPVSLLKMGYQNGQGKTDS